jgi:hypothetical protein
MLMRIVRLILIMIRHINRLVPVVLNRSLVKPRRPFLLPPRALSSRAWLASPVLQIPHPQR